MKTRLIAIVVVGLAACQGTPEPGTAAETSYTVPHDSTIPDDSLGRSIRRGRALLLHTKDSLPEYVGNALTCTNCHPDAGTRPNAMPWIGVYGRFPQYRSRSASVQIIEDRIDDCFLRSMNGRKLPRESTEMRDMIAYMAFLSRGTAVGVDIPGQ